MLDDIREWISDNLRYILLGLGVILVLIIVVGIFRLVGGSGKSDKNASSDKAASTTVQTEKVTEGAVQDDAEAPVASLTKDDVKILPRVEEYYDALAAQDTIALAEMVAPWDDEVKDSLLANTMIEEYRNITSYSEDGLQSGEYLVFVQYDAKIKDIDTEVPSMVALYLTSESGGSLIVKADIDADKDVSDFITTQSNTAEVQKLRADVTQKFEAARAQDEALDNLLKGQEGVASSDEASGEENTSKPTTTPSEAVGQQMTTTATINIRQTTSTDSAIMGVLPEGTTVSVIADGSDGWVQISYNASGTVIEGYVKLDYLTSASGDGAAQQETTAEAGAQAETTAQAEGADQASADAAA